MRRHNERLYRTLRVWVRDETVLPSLMQRTLTQAYSRLSRLEDPDTFAVSLVQQAVEMGRSQCRQRFLSGLTRTATRLPLPPEADPESTQPVHTPLKSVEQSIDALPASTRSVFVLSEVEGLEVHDVAEALDLSMKTIHIRLERARRKIRRLVPAELNALLPKAFRLPTTLGERVVKAVSSHVAPEQTLVMMSFDIPTMDDH